MENPILEAKKEIIEWVNNLDDLETIQELLDLKNENNSNSQIFEPSKEYSLKDDFDERFAKGITGNELLERLFAHIEILPWKEK